MVGGADHVIDWLVWEMNQAGYLTEKAALREDEWSPELYAMISQAANKIVTATLKDVPNWGEREAGRRNS